MSSREQAETSRKGKLDKDEIKEMANGQWSAILSSHLSADLLDGRHHPCPKCGGKDRFRFTDMSGDGSLICNQCGRDIGDGFAAIQWLTGCSFGKAVHAVADHLGVKCKLPLPVDAGIEWATTEAETRTKLDLWLNFCGEGITLEACLANGMRAGTYWHNWPIVAIPGYDSSLDLSDPGCWIMWHITGKKLPVGPKDRREWVKEKSTGPKDRKCLIGRVGDLKSAKRIIKCEGPKDVLAIYPSLTEGDVAVTNAYGAAEDPGWMAGVLGKADAEAVYVIHDCDVAGVEGSEKWSRAIALARPDNQCHVVELPFEVTESKGKDLRDWCNG